MFAPTSKYKPPSFPLLLTNVIEERGGGKGAIYLMSWFHIFFFSFVDYIFMAKHYRNGGHNFASSYIQPSSG